MCFKSPSYLVKGKTLETEIDNYFFETNDENTFLIILQNYLSGGGEFGYRTTLHVATSHVTSVHTQR